MKSAEHLTIIVTGANSGIGRETVRGMAKLGHNIIMACRNMEAGESVRREIIKESGNNRIELLHCDLSSQKSIRSFVSAFSLKHGRLNVLINNAANFDQTIKEPRLTENGHELIFATNHLGPFLLSNLLLDKLKEGNPSRIITIASKGLLVYPFLSVEFDNLAGEKKFSAQHAYYHSKLAQLMFTFDLSARLRNEGVSVNCLRVPSVRVDPGRYEHLKGWKRRIYEIKRKKAMTPAEMAETYIRLAIDPEFADVTGKYFDEKCREVKASHSARDVYAMGKLWEISAAMTGLKG